MVGKDIAWRREPQRQARAVLRRPAVRGPRAVVPEDPAGRRRRRGNSRRIGERTYQGKRGYPVTVDTDVDQVDAGRFDALVIPGGFAPDQLRRYDKVLQITREIYRAGKPLAFICHAGWVPISAKILKGKRATSVRAIKDDMENAGVIWEDSPVVVDGNLISSRTPAD